YPLYGHELSEDINPIEASLKWAVKLSKDFIGKKQLLDIFNAGTSKKRVGFVMEERAVPRQGYAVYAEGRQVGRVSSGTYSPNIDKFIGMAFVENTYAEMNTTLDIKVRDKLYKADVTPWPFVKLGVKKQKAVF
ncbi:MAG: glycine cleavage system aminomethyltransferase GcvT, partial [Candidatus Aureabacteria bacterium]|nr:glycine cleavage system aminomethyltransferase GcvT [Candidatus Auribacterota bacterium]